MPENSKHNLLFFEAPSMRKLYGILNAWQEENRKRFLSVSIQMDGGMFCCNPTEVVICGGSGGSEARVADGDLMVWNHSWR